MTNDANANQHEATLGDISVRRTNNVLTVVLPADWSGITTITTNRKTSYTFAVSAMPTVTSISFATVGAVPDHHNETAPPAEPPSSPSEPETTTVAKDADELERWLATNTSGEWKQVRRLPPPKRDPWDD